MCGVEYFAHPWEFGPRKTKELMLTGDAIDVDEAHALGMVSARCSPPTSSATARSSSPGASRALPTMTALLIKESVNQTVDNMGFHNALNACFTIHQLNHSHWARGPRERLPGGAEEDGHPELEGRAADRPVGQGPGTGRSVRGNDSLTSSSDSAHSATALAGSTA